MSPSLGQCARCFDPTPAVTRERLTVGAGTYDLPLCDRHADMFQREMYGWTRVGTLVDPPRAFASKRPDLEPRRGRVVASHLHVPVARAPETLPPEAPAARPVTRLSPPALPLGHEEWTFSEHALDRSRSREVSKEEALWCVLCPDVVRPGTQAGTKAHVRGNVQVVVNPTQRRIITVIDRSVTTEQELAHAASY